jgi:hypothetical protein
MVLLEAIGKKLSATEETTPPPPLASSRPFLRMDRLAQQHTKVIKPMYAKK